MAKGVIYVATGQQIIRLSAEGTVFAALPLGATVTTPAAASGDRAAAGCADGMIRVFQGDKLLWSSPVGATPTAVAVGKDAVYAAVASGVINAFAP